MNILQENHKQNHRAEKALTYQKESLPESVNIYTIRESKPLE